MSSEKSSNGTNRNGPLPTEKHPMNGFPQVCFIKNVVRNPDIIVGDYSYYDDPAGPEEFEKNVLYHYPFIGDKLIIGKFCAIATGVKFVMNGANHKMSGFTTYPFSIFAKGWEKVLPKPGELPYRGDTVIGNDVWIGCGALLMPGARIGDGAVIAARSVVSGRVKPYSVVGGNPARLLLMRFPPETIRLLRKLKWWDMPAEWISANLETLTRNDLAALRRLAKEA